MCWRRSAEAVRLFSRIDPRGAGDEIDDGLEDQPTVAGEADFAGAADGEPFVAAIDLTAQVPQAMAAALRDGNLGVMDYYRMENLQSDTDMRRNLLGGDGATPPAAPQA